MRRARTDHQQPSAAWRLIAHLVQKRKPGEKIAVTVLRRGGRVNLTLPMQ